MRNLYMRRRNMKQKPKPSIMNQWRSTRGKEKEAVVVAQEVEVDQEKEKERKRVRNTNRIPPRRNTGKKRTEKNK